MAGPKFTASHDPSIPSTFIKDDQGSIDKILSDSWIGRAVFILLGYRLIDIVDLAIISLRQVRSVIEVSRTVQSGDHRL